MTTDNRKVQLETELDSTGAKRGFQEIKDAAKDMANAVGQAGNQAVKADILLFMRKQKLIA